ncbi:MAG: hypothetical protein R6U69_01205 [Marinobacter sp.]|uniref:hypothetical protein n=1 Tax=Marinobacter sp. TaxID=50741 RepID=UPI0039769BEB
MTVTGDIEDSFQGYAVYTDASLELGQFALGLTDNRNFALDLSIRVDDKAPPPEGSYAIGGSYGADTAHVQATFSKFEDGSFMNPTQYRAGGDAEGVLEITSSSDTEVVATFQFTGQDNAGKQIAITDGAFHARQVKGGINQ